MDNSIDLQFIDYVVKSLVSKPDAVHIDRTIDEKGVLLELTVDPEDLGRVIGKRGATAQSLRTLLRALGTKNDARYNLKIVDNGMPAPLRQDKSAKADDAVDSTADTAAAEVEKADTTEPQVPDTTPADSSAAAKPEPESDMVSKTRAELADLDDLDL